MSETDRELQLLSAFIDDMQNRIAGIKPPDRMTELRAEYWKAGARAAIQQVNEALQTLATLAKGDGE